MSVTYNPQQDRYFVCPQCGPYGMGYGNYTVPNCYGGDCSTLCGNPRGPYFQCSVRERLRDFYADGVQGGSPACGGQRCDLQSETGLRSPFSTYAVNYWGDNDEYRERPYGGGVSFGSDSRCSSLPDSDYEAHGHYVCSSDFGCSTKYENPLQIRPVPGVKEARTLASMAWTSSPPISGNVCTRSM